MKRDDVFRLVAEARERGEAADLYGADLRDMDLSYARLSRADLRRADLNRANLHYADLLGSDLSRADLRDADLHYTNIRDADLLGAKLQGANLSGTIWCGLQLNGMRSGEALHMPTSGGWKTRVGCWTGTLDELEALISGNTGWPEAKGDECDRRRPELLAFVALARAHEAYYPDAVDEIRRARGGDKS